MVYMPTKINKLRKVFKELPEDKKDYLYELRNEVEKQRIEKLKVKLLWKTIALVYIIGLPLFWFSTKIQYNYSYKFSI